MNSEVYRDDDFLFGKALPVMVHLWYIFCTPYYGFMAWAIGSNEPFLAALFGLLFIFMCISCYNEYHKPVRAYIRGEYRIVLRKPVKIIKPLAVAEENAKWLAFFDNQNSYYQQALGSIGNGRYVYVIRDANVTGFYKIGKTTNPNRRLNRFGVKLPFDVQIIFVIKTPDHHSLEYGLHTKFADRRVSGEWFDLGFDDLDYIAGLMDSNGHSNRHERPQGQEAP